MRAYVRTTLLLAVALWPIAAARGQILLGGRELGANSTADLTYQGVNYHAEQTVTSAVFASAQALAGLTTTPEARTAARVGDQAIACNARLDDKFHLSF